MIMKEFHFFASSVAEWIATTNRRELPDLIEYMGGLAYIEADCQIANFHNNNLRNNFWGGYLINFNNGIPTPEEQGDIERQIKRKFSGTDNAGRFVVTFNDDVSKALE